MFFSILFFLLPLFAHATHDNLFPDENPIIAHHVNAISGHLTLSVQDDAVIGPAPFPLKRSYSSAGALEGSNRVQHHLKGEWTLQGGWSFFPQLQLAVRFDKTSKKKTIALLQEPSGESVAYKYSHEESKHVYFLKPTTSTASSLTTISGRYRTKNLLLKVNKKKKRATLYLPTGGTRRYEKRSFSQYYMLTREVLPSGHQILYFYLKNGDLENIYLVSPNGLKNFGWMKFKIEGKKLPYPISVETSDGHHFRYTFLNYQNKGYLEDVVSDFRPHEKCHYGLGREGTGAHLEKVKLANEEQFFVHYNLPKDKKDEKSWREHRSPCADKVHFIAGPLGFVASFFYDWNRTDVRDAEGVLTRYHHDTNKLHRIEFFDEKEQFYSQQHFIWDGDLLRSRVLSDAHGKQIFSKTFHYDNAGNVTKETLFGNLTGASEEPADYLEKTYDYLPRFNVPILEIEEEGPTYRYRYHPHTDLLTAKLTYDGPKIVRREFFLYDHHHLLSVEILDDGRGENHDDLTNVSERHIKRYENDTPSGLPSAMAEYYWEDGQEKLLRRVEYSYKNNRASEEKIFDADGVYRFTTKIDYDDRGNVRSKTDPLGQENTYHYDHFKRLKIAEEVGSPVKTYDYDHAGFLKVAQVGEKETSFTYDSKGRVKTEKDPRGHETKYTYDCFSRCIQMQFPKVLDETGTLYQPTTTYSYDIPGNQISEKDSREVISEIFYTTFGKPYKILHPNNTETRHTYNKCGTLAKTVLPDGAITECGYDIFQRVTSKQVYSRDRELLSAEIWDYDAFHLRSYTDPQGLTTNYFYDGAGRKVREEAEDRVRIFTYDALGFLERTSDGCMTHVQIHDVAGRVIEEWIEDTASHIENKMVFDYEENRKSSAHRITSQGETLDLFAYDKEGHLFIHTDPEGNTTKFIHTDDRKTIIDALGNSTIEIYDSLNRLACLEKKDAREHTISKEETFYDRSGNKAKVLTTLYDDTTQVKTLATIWEYNRMGQVERQIDAAGKITLFDYFPEQNKETKTLPSGITITTTHDGIGRVLELVSSEGTVHYNYLYSPRQVEIYDLVQNCTLRRTYDAFGGLLEESTGCSWEYDAQGRCKRFTLPDLSRVEYTYRGMHLFQVIRHDHSGAVLYAHTYNTFDPNGHVEQEEMIGNLGTVVTEHDLFERPSRQTSAYLTQSIAYGSTHLVKNIQSTLLGQKTYTYDPLNQLSSENETSYHFDSLGNPTDCIVSDANELMATPTTTLDYDPDGNPKQCTTPSATYLYHYDALGRLIEIETEEKTIRYTYDPFSRLYSKEVTGSPTTFYLYDQEREIGSFQNGELCELKILGLGIKREIGAAVAIELSSVIFAPLHDFNGNIIALVSLQGEIVESYKFTAFGSEESFSEHRNPWRFSSKRTEDTGLIYFGKRFYDPRLGRWLTPDPSGYAEGINLYLFVLNSPLNRCDLFGLESDPYFPQFRIEFSIPEIPTIDFSKGTLVDCTYTGISTKFFVCCGYMNHLKFTPEELTQGIFNLFEHIGDLVPQGSENDIAMVLTWHGMGNTLDDAFKLNQGIHNRIPENTLQIGPFNECPNFFSDIIRVMLEFFGFQTQRVKMAADLMSGSARLLVDKSLDPKKPMKMKTIAHSEGGLVKKRAIQSLDSKTQEKLFAVCQAAVFGGAKPISNLLVNGARKYYSKGDWVTRWFAFRYKNNPNYEIHMVPAISKCHEKTAYVIDHAFLGSTQQGALEDDLNRTREGYRFYDGQTR